jgi:hypothetical protein
MHPNLEDTLRFAEILHTVLFLEKIFDTIDGIEGLGSHKKIVNVNSDQLQTIRGMSDIETVIRFQTRKTDGLQESVDFLVPFPGGLAKAIKTAVEAKLAALLAIRGN